MDKKSKVINLNRFLLIALLFLMLFSIGIYSQEAILKYTNGSWNFESQSNEWFIKNGTMIGWCPLNNCTGINDSWYSNTMSFTFNIDNQSETLVGEDLSWDCINLTLPDGLPENDTYGNLSMLNCSVITNALNNSVRLNLVYTLYNFSIRLKYKLLINNLGDKNYSEVIYTWHKDVNNLNNTKENDFMVSKGVYYSLIGDNTTDYNKTKDDLSQKGNFYEILFTEANETNPNKIGSQLFGLNFEKNNTNISMDDVRLEIKQKGQKPTKIKFITNFGNLSSGQNIIYDYLAGGDVTTGVSLSLTLDNTRPPTNRSYVGLDILAKNSSGSIFTIVNNGSFCVINPPYTSASCRGVFKDGDIDMPSVAINSQNRLVVMYQNDSNNSNFVITSTDFGTTWSTPQKLEGIANGTLAKMSLTVDKNDNFIACAYPQSIGLPSYRWMYYYYSSDGSSWSAYNISDVLTIGDTRDEGCDIEADTNNNIHIVAKNWSSGDVTVNVNVVHYNFTPSQLNVVQKTVISTFIGSALEGNQFSLAIDKNNTLYVARDSPLGTVLYVSYDGGMNWVNNALTALSETDYPDVISDNPNSYWIIVQEDGNTNDDDIYLINGSGTAGAGGDASSSKVKIQNPIDPQQEAGYQHQLGSLYPAFNRVAGKINYIFWTDEIGTGNGIWNFYNYTYSWVDVGLPESRFYSDNATNGTTNTNQAFYAYAECFDESNISSIIFSIDDGVGSFTNYTINYNSPQYYQGLNFTYNVTATANENVIWKFYCNDTAGNWHNDSLNDFWAFSVPTVGVPQKPLSKGIAVWANGTKQSAKPWVAYFNGSQFTNITEANSMGHLIDWIDVEASNVRNETAILAQRRANAGFLSVQFYNGSGWGTNNVLSEYASSYWNIGDFCYRQNGDLIIGYGNYTLNSQYGNRTFKYNVWNGIEFLNYTGLNFSSETIAPDLVRLACDPRTNNVIFMYYNYRSGTYGDLGLAILDSNNNLINNTVLIYYVSAYETTGQYDVVSFDGGWLNNGTGVVCFGNYTSANYKEANCIMWSPENKHWTSTFHSQSDTYSDIKQGYVSTSYYNNTFMYSTIQIGVGDLTFSYFNTSGQFSFTDSSYNTIYYQLNNHIFEFLNNTNNDGVGYYFEQSLYYGRYNFFNGTTKKFEPVQTVESVTIRQPTVISDPYSDYAFFGFPRATTNLTIKYFNASSNTVSNVKTNITKNMYWDIYKQTYDFTFLPSSYPPQEAIPPWWNNNKTPTGNLKKNTITTLEVKLNDDALPTSNYNFSTNASGSWITGINRNWTPNQVITNNTLISLNKGNTICYYWNFSDGSGKQNNTDTWCFIVNNTAPTNNPYSPLIDNPVVLDGADINFTINCGDIDSDTTTAYWLTNSTLNETGTPCRDFTFYANMTLGRSGQNFNITAYVSDNEVNVSKTWILRVGSPPSCENGLGTQYPASPAVYAYNQTHQINTTCYTGALIVDVVNLSYNNSYNTSFNELFADGDAYYYQAKNFSVGDYAFCWLVSTTSGDNNYADCPSDQFIYQVIQANASINMSFNVSTPITYPQDVAIYCNTSFIGSQIGIYDNITLLASSNNADAGTIAIVSYNFSGNLSAGLHNLSCQNIQTANYTSSVNYTDFIVNQKTPTCSITFREDITEIYLGNTTNATGNCSPIETWNSWQMYREYTPEGLDFINITYNESGKNATLGIVGTYQYIINVSNTQNYSFVELNYFFDVLTANGQPTVILVKPENNTADNNNSRILNWTTTEPDSSNINITIYLSESLANLSISNITTFWNVNVTADPENESFNATNLESKTYYWQVCSNDSVLTGCSLRWQFTRTTGFADNVSCTSSAQCSSGYCDITDINPNPIYTSDKLCFTPRNSSRGGEGLLYFHDEPPPVLANDTIACEYEANVGAVNPYCDEREINDSVNVCNEAIGGETYFEDYCKNDCSLGDNVTLCRSSLYDSSCSGDVGCEGKTAGVGQCSATCTYDECLPPEDGNNWRIATVCVFINQMLKFNGSIFIDQGGLGLYDNTTFNFTSTNQYLTLNGSGAWFNMTNKSQIIGGY